MSVPFDLRFDFRNPSFAGTMPAERYDAALEMAEWADRLGCVTASDIDELRATGQYAVMTADQYIDELRAAALPFAFFHPLCGGMPIDLAWSSLKLFEHVVRPAFEEGS